MRSKMKIKMGISNFANLMGCGFVVLGTKVSTRYLIVAFSLLAIGATLQMTICCPHCGRRMINRFTFRVPTVCPKCGKAISD